MSCQAQNVSKLYLVLKLQKETYIFFTNMSIVFVTVLFENHSIQTISCKAIASFWTSKSHLEK